MLNDRMWKKKQKKSRITHVILSDWISGFTAGRLKKYSKLSE